MKQFQSLSGFQVRCNARTTPKTIRINEFQSLSGFQVRCNSLGIFEHQRHGPGFNPYRVFKFVATPAQMVVGKDKFTKFQSLSGFQVRCNLPMRFSPLAATSWFQSLSGFQVRCNDPKLVISGGSLAGFQSLSGFQVRCNNVVTSGLPGNPEVSIPIGFSSSLQPKVALA